MARRLLLFLVCLLPPVLGVAAWGFTAWRLEVNAAAVELAAVPVVAQVEPAPELVVQAAAVLIQAVSQPPVTASAPDSDYDDYEDGPAPDTADSETEGWGSEDQWRCDKPSSVKHS